MMKTPSCFRWRSCIAATIALLAVSCGRSPDATTNTSPDVAGAVTRYLAETVAKDYADGWDHCIPVPRIVAVDASDPSDIRVWGDFMVHNYRLEGDTLHFVSGGTHPGLMHLRETDGALAVFAFDQVQDGSEYRKSGLVIFGEHFNAWQKLASDDVASAQGRLRAVAEYVLSRGLPAKFVKDYGWEPVAIPSSTGR